MKSLITDQNLKKNNNKMGVFLEKLQPFNDITHFEKT